MLLPKAAMSLSHGFFVSLWSASIFLLSLAIASLAPFDILLSLERIWLPNALKDPALFPFYKTLQRCVDGTLQASEQTGAFVDPPVLISKWAIILFSQFPEHRKFKLLYATRIFESQLVVDIESRVNSLPVEYHSQEVPPVDYR